MAGVKKPPKIFWTALSKANTLPNKSLMIGIIFEARAFWEQGLLELHRCHFNAELMNAEHEYCDMISDLISEIKFFYL